MHLLFRVTFPAAAVLLAACSGDTFSPTESSVGAAGAATTGGSGGSGVATGGASVGQGGLPSGNGGEGGSIATGGSGGDGGDETAGASGTAGGGGSTEEGGQGGGASQGGAAGAGQGAAAGTTGGGGKGGAAGAAGVGGGAGLGGVGAMGGIGGAGGGPVCATPCVGNSVCNSMGKCVTCAESDRMVFGAGVERFAPPSGWTNAMFPRETQELGNSSLVVRLRRFYGTENLGNNDEIVRLSLNGGAVDGVVDPADVAPHYVNKPEDDSAALVLPQGYAFGDGVELTGGYDYSNAAFVDVPASYRLTIIDSRRVSLGRRGIYVARWWISSTAAPGSEAYTQFGFFNAAATLNYSLALAQEMAPSMARAYWTRRGVVEAVPGAMKLMTAVVGQPATIAQVTVQPPAPSSCELALSEDAEAWITPRGGKLLFTATCGTSQRRLYSARVEANPAQLTATPISIGTGFQSTAPLHSPSLSPDQCTLWYSQGGKIYSAPRQ